MVLLGVTLLVSLLGAYLLPDLVPRFIERGIILRAKPEESQSRSFAALRMTGKYFSLQSIVYGLGSIVGLLSLVTLVFVLYWVNQHILHSFLSSADEHSCYFLAECLRKGKLYVDTPPMADFFKVVHVGMRDGKWFSVYPPGWPLIWALGLQFNIVDWLNPVMSALAVFFFYLAGSKLFSRLSTVVGLTVMVLSPFFMFTAASYFSHATCLLCISVFLYAFLRWREARELANQRSAESHQAVILSPTEGEESPEGSFAALRMTKGKSSEKAEIFWASLCAFAIGYGLMTRYLTMAVVAGPFLLYHYLPIFFGWKGWGQVTFLRIKLPSPFVAFKRPQLRKSDWIAAGIIAAFMILILYQNYLVTGKAFRAPNKHDKSWERLGFRKDYTPVDAFFYLIARVFFLMDWFAPAVVGVYLVIVFQMLRPAFVILTSVLSCESKIGGKDLAFGFFDSPKSGSTQNDELKGSMNANGEDSIQTLFCLTMVFIAIAYFFYYSWGGNQYGPRYYWEGMPFLCIAVADWVVCRWRRGSQRVRKFLLVFVIASITSSGVLFVKQADLVAESSRQRKALYDLAEKTIQALAIVFIHGFLGDKLVMSEEDAVRNSPFLNGRILYAHDLGERNRELIVAYPGRGYYRGTYDREKKIPRLELMVG